MTMNTEKIFIYGILDIYIGSFFELLGRGMLSDENFKRELEISAGFTNVKKFHQLDSQTYNHISEILLNKYDIDTLCIIKIINEKFNDYLIKITLPNLSDAFSDFDETVSDENFLRVIENMPSENDNVYNWFYLIWEYIFEQVSNFEKSISFATTLHSESSDNLGALQSKIASANDAVDKLSEAINGGENKIGLVTKKKNKSIMIGKNG